MKKYVKKLALNKETIWNLNDRALDKVVGGNLGETHECWSGPGASCSSVEYC